MPEGQMNETVSLKQVVKHNKVSRSIFKIPWNYRKQIYFNSFLEFWLGAYHCAEPLTNNYMMLVNVLSKGTQLMTGKLHLTSVLQDTKADGCCSCRDFFWSESRAWKQDFPPVSLRELQANAPSSRAKWLSHCLEWGNRPLRCFASASHFFFLRVCDSYYSLHWCQFFSSFLSFLSFFLLPSPPFFCRQ